MTRREPTRFPPYPGPSSSPVESRGGEKTRQRRHRPHMRWQGSEAPRVVPGSATCHSRPQDLHTCRRLTSNSRPIELYGFTKHTREKFERALRRQTIRRTDADIIIFVTIVLTVIAFACYGVIAVASKIELTPRKTPIEQHWYDYEQRRLQAAEGQH